jgi:hypothetical protein
MTHFLHWIRQENTWWWVCWDPSRASTCLHPISCIYQRQSAERVPHFSLAFLELLKSIHQADSKIILQMVHFMFKFCKLWDVGAEYERKLLHGPSKCPTCCWHWGLSVQQTLWACSLVLWATHGCSGPSGALSTHSPISSAIHLTNKKILHQWFTLKTYFGTQ